jgi:hypothetical protein
MSSKHKVRTYRVRTILAAGVASVALAAAPAAQASVKQKPVSSTKPIIMGRMKPPKHILNGMFKVPPKGIVMGRLKFPKSKA